jgi:hypothetical protein
LQQIAAAVYQSIGVPAQDAELAADTLVQADLWGHQSHGLLRLGWSYARLKSGAMKAVTQTSLAVDAGAICVMDLCVLSVLIRSRVQVRLSSVTGYRVGLRRMGISSVMRVRIVITLCFQQQW